MTIMLRYSIGEEHGWHPANTVTERRPGGRAWHEKNNPLKLFKEID